MITNSTDHVMNLYELVIDYEKERSSIKIDEICKYWVPELDSFLGGIWASELVVIWAQTWVWKSDMAYTIAETNAKRWKKVLLFALEGDLSEIASRRLQREISIVEPINTISFRFNTNPTHKDYTTMVIQGIEIEREKWRHWMENVIIFKKRDIPTFDFISELIDLYRDTVDMIIVDHLNYIEFWDRKNEIEEISKVMRRLKIITDTIKKPVVLVSHMRKPDKERDPTLYDLYWSSNIAKEATTILLLSRCEASYLDNREWYNDIVWTKIQIAKSRAWLPVPSYFAMDYSLRKKKFIKWKLLEESKAKPTDKIDYFTP